MSGDLPESAVIRRSDGVVSEVLEGETLVYDPDSGTYLKLNATGGWLWRALEAPASVGALSASLAAQHGIEEDRAVADVRAFLTDLRARGLVAVEG